MEAESGDARDRGDLEAVGALNEPTRRRLFDHVVAAREPVTRDEASAALGIDRSLAAYHLDKLVDEGLLRASFARPEGRGGPGAGRPAKRYERGEREVAVSVPPRDYRLLAELFARAAEDDDSGAIRRRVERAAREAGVELGEVEAARRDLVDVLAELGFEPFVDAGVVRLANCPFHRLAQEHTELVCGMNLALFEGLLLALAAEARPRLEPHPDRCCVVIERG